MSQNWHVIETYEHAKNMILCVCGWYGSGSDPWASHRKENAGTPAPKGFSKRKYVYSPGMIYTSISKK